MNLKQLEDKVMELDREAAKREAVEGYKRELKKAWKDNFTLIVAVAAFVVSVLSYLQAVGE